MSTMVTTRAKWQYPPPPTPRIIHLPRRPRRKQQPKSNAAPARHSSGDRKGKLEALFDQERTFSKTGEPIVLLGYDEPGRERVENRGGGVAAEEADKWRFQAEMLRAECNLLRMEREIALKKLERSRTQMQRTLRSTVQTLITVRSKMSDGETLGVVLEEEIEELAEKLEKLQRRSSRDSEGRTCSNFDKQACHLQRRLTKIGGTMSKENYANEVREMAEASLSMDSSSSIVSTRKRNDVHLEVLKRKMEGMSKGMLLGKVEEEYGSLLSSGHRSKVVEGSVKACKSSRQARMCEDDKVCSGHCKVIVWRILEQVRAETEQWSQMQEMLGKVREEMEELQASRDFWEDRALDSDSRIQTLHSTVEEWKEKALSYEAKVCRLEGELETREATRAKGLQEAPNEMEKRVLICRLKENDGRKKSHGGVVALKSKRSPFRDIGNLSPLVRQRSSKSVFPIPSNG